MTSRYEGMRPVKTAFRPGTLFGRQIRPWQDWTFRFTFHQMTEDDRLDLLAHDYLGSAEDWWMILDANPEIIDPFNLPPGMLIRIPYVLG